MMSFSLIGCFLIGTDRGEILEARDVNLGVGYVAEEVELVLKLGLLYSHSEPAARPSMRQVVQFLECASSRAIIVWPLWRRLNICA
jgi:hypothetical protein